MCAFVFCRFFVKKFVYVIKKKSLNHNQALKIKPIHWITFFFYWQFYFFAAVLRLCNGKIGCTVVVHVQIRHRKNTFHIGLDTCIENSIKSRNVYTHNLNALAVIHGRYKFSIYTRIYCIGTLTCCLQWIEEKHEFLLFIHSFVIYIKYVLCFPCVWHIDCFFLLFLNTLLVVLLCKMIH